MDPYIQFDFNHQSFDIEIVQGDIRQTEGLESAIITSLFSDRRTDEPDYRDRRGWWGDSFEDHLTGSRLFQLYREKATDETLEVARETVLEALAWMVDDGIAERVEVETAYALRSREILEIMVTLHRPVETLKLKFNFVWRGQIHEL